MPEIALTLESMTTDELRAELSRSLAKTAAELLRLAKIVRTLEERGEDLEDLKIGLLNYLRLIAYDQLAPEVVVRFGGSPLTLRMVASLPLPDQRSLASGGSVTLVVKRPDGVFDKRLADPAKLTPGQLRQIFGRNQLRTEQEQILLLEDRREPKTKEKAKNQTISPDKKRGGVVVGRKFIPTGKVLEALADLGSGETVDPTSADSQILIRVTEEEHDILKHRAIDAKTTLNAMLRRALVVAGLFVKTKSVD